MKRYPIELGSMLFTMVEPHPGHEVEYNRWYERDHFYAGCMVGPWQFAGQRFVATRDLKALRYPTAANPITADPQIGSYLALYWVLAGHHDEWNSWAVEQVNWLHANGRMFGERDHIHTLLYDYRWAIPRDPDGVSIELALDHRYPGLAVTVGQLTDVSSGEQVEEWYRSRPLPDGVDLVAGFTPLPLLADAPGDVPRSEGADRRFMLLWFLNAPATDLWSGVFQGHGADLDASGLATHVWASPFLPTIPGTDTYTDELH